MVKWRLMEELYDQPGNGLYVYIFSGKGVAYDT